MEIFCDSIYVNVEEGDVSAQGNVLAREQGTRIYTEKLYYNYKKEEAYTKEAHVISPPWIVKGKKLKREGKKLELESPVFTTCDRPTPHYRMEASMIYLYENERVEAWHTRVYLGNIPVMYWPYYTQPVDGSKDPFEVKLGWNEVKGFFATLGYMLYFNQYNEWKASYSFMEQLGNRFDLDIKYGFSKESAGHFVGFYNHDKVKEAAGDPAGRWQITYNHMHNFSDDGKTRAGINISALSDVDLNKDLYETTNVFEQWGDASFNTTIGTNHTFSVYVKDSEQINTVTAKYEARSRVLPKVSYTMTSVPVPFIKGMYYNHTAGLTRNYEGTITNTVDRGDYYSYSGSFAPRITMSFPKTGFATLSGNADLSSGWTKHNENDDGWGEVISTVNTSETLNMEIMTGGRLNASVIHGYTKQLDKFEDLQYDGITKNSISLSLSGGYGIFDFRLSTLYDMKAPNSELLDKNDMARFSLLSITSNLRHSRFLLTFSSFYSLFSNQLKSFALTFSTNSVDKADLWSIKATTSYTNNLMDASGFPLAAPTDDAISFITSFTFKLTDEFDIGISREYDLKNKDLKTHNYNVTWHLHCWEAQFNWSERSDGVRNIFFTAYITAIPDFKISKPSTATPDFQQFIGY